MKINWFKIIDQNELETIISMMRACLCAIEDHTTSRIVIDLHYKNIISFLTIGSYCKDCVKEYWECECNVYLEIEINLIKVFLYDFTIYNFSKKLIYEFIKEIKKYSDNIYFEFKNYYENKLV